ncbi:hypothetical protein KUCAC02_010720, partial [Chaenocephalus aceratus]
TCTANSHLSCRLRCVCSAAQSGGVHVSRSGGSAALFCAPPCSRDYFRAPSPRRCRARRE